jgi:hypothetical protein
MLPIIGFPDIVGFADFFRRVFSWNSSRFKQYLSSLITGKKPTVRSTASRLVDQVDQSSLNRRRLEMLQSIRETRWRRKAS